MQSAKAKVLVYGATGAQARSLPWQLLAKGYTPYVLTRDPQQVTDAAKAGAVVVEGDINEAGAVRRANRSMDAVLLTIPFFASDRAGRIAIDAAQEAAISLIVWNTSGLIPTAKGERHGLNVRVDNADYLRRSGIPHIIFQPTVFLENLLLPETAHLITSTNVISYPTPAEKTVHWLAANDLGSLMVAALAHPELAGSRFVVGGQQAIDGPALADCFSEALGRTITYRPLSPADYAARLDKLLGKGQGKAITGGAAPKQEGIAKAPDIPVDMKPVLEKLPVAMTSVTDWVRANQKALSL
jgi:uncharacterized protein YbjT (DUF2867 family)